MNLSNAWAGTLWADSRMQILIPGLVLAGVILVGALIVMLVDRWRKSVAKQDTLSASDQLASYRILYEQGELSEEEFEQIRATLGGELRRTARKRTPSAPILNNPVLPSAVEEKPSTTGQITTEPPSEPPSTGIRPE